MSDAPRRRRVVTTTPAQPTLDDQMRGAVPTVLFARSSQLSNDFPTLVRHARTMTGGAIGIGVVARLPHKSFDVTSRFLSRLSAVPLRLADPDLYRAPNSGGPDARVGVQEATRHPWFANAPAPSGRPVTAWITEVLERQEAAGATALLSATGWVSSVNAAAGLARAMRWVEASRDIAGERPMFVNLTFGFEWLADSSLMSMIRHELVESTEDHWYLRFRWPQIEPPHGQLRRRVALDNYKALAQTAQSEGKTLLLANSGMTGWVATALGASGFSTGPSGKERAYAQERAGGGVPGRPPPPEILRYFERNLLHIVEQAAHVQLLGTAGYVVCACPYCASNGISRRSVAPWNKELAAMHYLLQCAGLTSLLAGRRGRAAALAEVRSASGLSTAVSAAMPAWATPNVPQHLSEWERLLA